MNEQERCSRVGERSHGVNTDGTRMKDWVGHENHKEAQKRSPMMNVQFLCLFVFFVAVLLCGNL